MDDFKDSSSALVADVDCTAGGKDLCEKHKVSGYPTIKWGDPNDLKDYNGGRDLAALKKFAEENLGPTCGPDNLDLCDEADKKLIKKYLKWDVDELDLSIEENDEKIAKIESASKKVTDGLQNQISKLQGKIEKENSKKDDLIAKERTKVGYKFMKALTASKNTEDAEGAEDPDFEADSAEDNSGDGGAKEEL